MIRYGAWTAILALALAGAYVVYGSNVFRTGGLPFAAIVGGPFELTAHDGTRFSSRNLAGRPYALFFGFTNCPDVCPTTLLELTNAMSELGPDADKLRVLYVTVDPERDTQAFLKDYMQNFDKRFIGLTGTPDEIAAVAKSFRAVYRRVPTSGGYTMDHTATVYLMNAAGELAGTLSYQEDQKIQIAKLRRLVQGQGANP
jgi:protein SCO1/2